MPDIKVHVCNVQHHLLPMLEQYSCHFILILYSNILHFWVGAKNYFISQKYTFILAIATQSAPSTHNQEVGSSWSPKSKTLVYKGKIRGKKHRYLYLKYSKLPIQQKSPNRVELLLFSCIFFFFSTQLIKNFITYLPR